MSIHVVLLLSTDCTVSDGKETALQGHSQDYLKGVLNLALAQHAQMQIHADRPCASCNI